MRLAGRITEGVKFVLPLRGFLGLKKYTSCDSYDLGKLGRVRYTVD
jgi:hypothetical protein